MRRLMERIRVRAPHEAVADETDVQILHSRRFPASSFLLSPVRFQLPASLSNPEVPESPTAGSPIPESRITVTVSA